MQQLGASTETTTVIPHSPPRTACETPLPAAPSSGCSTRDATANAVSSAAQAQSLQACSACTRRGSTAAAASLLMPVSEATCMAAIVLADSRIPSAALAAWSADSAFSAMA
mmetsp:Transcript_82123/g.206615  ORF Transcript_82123/g.206615 Transcript_82123/m.206615 type:complete len:111 (-) Transcript_82123:254-586(-)